MNFVLPSDILFGSELVSFSLELSLFCRDFLCYAMTNVGQHNKLVKKKTFTQFAKKKKYLKERGNLLSHP